MEFLNFILFFLLLSFLLSIRCHRCCDLHHTLHAGVPDTLHVPSQGNLPHQWGQGGGVCWECRCSHHEQWPQLYGDHRREQKRVAYLRVCGGGWKQGWVGVGMTLLARRERSTSDSWAHLVKRSAQMEEQATGKTDETGNKDNTHI